MVTPLYFVSPIIFLSWEKARAILRFFGSEQRFAAVRKRQINDRLAQQYDGSTWVGYAPKAPLCKGSCREATEGLCGEMFPIRLNYGEYATSYCGNPSATSVRYLRHLPLHKGGFGRSRAIATIELPS